MRRLSRQLAVLQILWLLHASPVSATEDAPTCPPGQSPAFSLGFASLQTRLGPAMGDPTECEHADPITGDVFQRTTTGLALYRHDTNTAIFTNGRERWALTGDDVAHWSGWHGSAAPADVAAPSIVDEALQSPPAAGTYMAVEAVTIVEISDDTVLRLVVRRGATVYLIETGSDCPGNRLSPGDVAFVLSPSEFAGPDSRLILTPGGDECPITTGRPL